MNYYKLTKPFFFLSFLGLCAFTFSNQASKADNTYIPSSIDQEKDSLYSQKVESILMDMKYRYGSNFKDSMQKHMFEMRDQLIGVKMDPFSFTDINGNKVEMKDFLRPTVMEISASWCGPCIATTEVINDLSKTYQKKLQFLVLTHDVGKRAQEFAAKFDQKRVLVVPSLTTLDIMDAIKLKVGEFNHLFPFPTAYFLDKDRRIVGIQIGGSLAGEFPDEEGNILTITKEQAYRDNLKLLQAGIDKILLN